MYCASQCSYVVYVDRCFHVPNWDKQHALLSRINDSNKQAHVIAVVHMCSFTSFFLLFDFRVLQS